ncbi:aminotransferase class V-fold PLP-dependent enzyme [Tengunoibacter tsumagoiensis]|uniref:Cysteine lyase n=1 Tax=Tengunoibacter tsumagoiensis TaxID=2014871 RepID=A0A402A0M0_9CHLR|nr:aminotransferase class V-fold PLP-dependent enzyme [Tengunoibacter tsumagoiensis]GCE12697.1 cysteine lyase [Tengunoibacter tsumagoiensis]
MTTISHVQRIRQTLPAVESRIYLNAGTFGPIPKQVVQAMQARIQEELAEGRLGMQSYEQRSLISQQVRERVAHLLHADADEIALTANTSEGMNIATYGLDWQAGDEVITTNHEHLGALGPLYQLRERRGIVIRMADLGERADRPLVAAIEKVLTPRTRLIVLSHVTWTTGTVLDVRAASRLGKARGIPVLIDGAQSAGNIAINVKELEADLYAIPMQKWLCGPDGTGALYIRRDLLDRIAPTYAGYPSKNHLSEREWELKADAQRFEVGGRHMSALAGQLAALQWLEDEIGYDWLFERIADLNDYAYAVLKDIPGLTVLTPQPGSNGLLSFKLANVDDAEAVSILQKQHGIYLRNLANIHALRISTGFYNTQEDIDHLAKAVVKLF